MTMNFWGRGFAGRPEGSGSGQCCQLGDFLAGSSFFFGEHFHLKRLNSGDDENNPKKNNRKLAAFGIHAPNPSFPEARGRETQPSRHLSAALKSEMRSL